MDLFQTWFSFAGLSNELAVAAQNGAIAPPPGYFLLLRCPMLQHFAQYLPQLARYPHRNNREGVSRWHHCTQESRKGGFSKGGFCIVQCHAQGSKNTRGHCQLGHWAQQCVWDSERHSEERRMLFAKTPLLKTPVSWFLIHVSHDMKRVAAGPLIPTAQGAELFPKKRTSCLLAQPGLPYM